MAYLPEERGLYRNVKVLDALSYYGQLKGMKVADANQAARGLLERVGLQDSAGQQVKALSKGMQQKVQLCTALIGDPRLLVLDEPFSGLDPINVQLFEDVLHERRAAGATVLLSTHQMNKVEEVCDRALMINRGHMVLYGSVREIRQRYAGHAVRVRAQGLPDQIAGVQSIVALNGEHELTLAPESQATAVLRSLLDRGVEVESFTRAALPLEDIFVRVVQEGIGLDGGESGPPTVDQHVGSAVAR
jgi:ABC-2 type transport system ATP-binding protein